MDDARVADVAPDASALMLQGAAGSAPLVRADGTGAPGRHPQPAAQNEGEDAAAPVIGKGATALPAVRLDGFNGSLDLLLELARGHAIDIAKISLHALVEQFITTLEQARHDVPLERRADWLVTASWFALLKSQLLLPDERLAARAEQEVRTARDHLLEKARVEAAAAWLTARRPQLGVDVFARGRPETFARQHTGDIVGLLRACLWLLRRPVDPPPDIYRPRRLWRPPEAIAHLEAVLSGRPEGGELLQFLPRHVFASPTAPAVVSADPAEPDDKVPLRTAIASTLFAALELARRGSAACDQPRGFGPILVLAATRDPE
jgi:segregation and condensation protein A